MLASFFVITVLLCSVSEHACLKLSLESLFSTKRKTRNKWIFNFEIFYLPDAGRFILFIYYYFLFNGRMLVTRMKKKGLFVRNDIFSYTFFLHINTNFIPYSYDKHTPYTFEQVNNFSLIRTSISSFFVCSFITARKPWQLNILFNVWWWLLYRTSWISLNKHFKLTRSVLFLLKLHTYFDIY